MQIDGRKLDTSFPRRVFLTCGIVVILALYPLKMINDAGVTRAFVASAVLTLLNVLAGYTAIEYSFAKSYTTFLKAVLGGMGIRLLVMLGVMVVLIEIFEYPAAPLLVSALGFYLLYLVLEVVFIQRKVNIKSQG